MYLLNPQVTGPLADAIKFTFHYVSIKSLSQNTAGDLLSDLHSTMYLLNPYVFNPQFMLYVHLHSTMYLLNPKAVEKEDVLLDKFTFHYVSIKSQNSAT